MILTAQALEASTSSEERLKQLRDQLKREAMEAAIRAESAERSNAELAVTVASLTEQLAVPFLFLCR